MMKKRIKFITPTAIILVAALTMMSAMPTDHAITHEDGMTVINTTSIAKSVKGYTGATPLKIYIKGKKIVKIEALKNQETPKFFSLVKRQLLDKWNGKTVKEASKMKVDGVTGATFSSNAVIKNVEMGLEYYKKNK